jgi:ribonuclease P protein component
MVRRSEFLRANAGIRAPMPGFILILHPLDDAAASAGFGITATKKLGGAVVRNRAKRRLRALVRDVFPRHALPGHDHVLIARADSLSLPYAQLRTDLCKALSKGRKRLAERGSTVERASPGRAT